MIVIDDRVARFVADTCGVGFCPPWTCMGIERAGKITAGVVFNVFEGGDVHVSVAGHGWTRGFLEAVGAYVYGTLRCERMTIVTASEDVAVLAVRFGGQREGVLRSHFGRGQDGIIVGILRDEWRFARLMQNTRG